MQHAWLLTARGFRPANRFHLFMGVMAYLSSPLWLLFLIISTINVFDLVTSPPPDAGNAQDYTSVFGYEIELPAALTLLSLWWLRQYTLDAAEVAAAEGALRG